MKTYKIILFIILLVAAKMLFAQQTERILYNSSDFKNITISNTLTTTDNKLIMFGSCQTENGTKAFIIELSESGDIIRKKVLQHSTICNIADMYQNKNGSYTALCNTRSGKSLLLLSLNDTCSITNTLKIAQNNSINAFYEGKCLLPHQNDLIVAYNYHDGRQKDIVISQIGNDGGKKWKTYLGDTLYDEFIGQIIKQNNNRYIICATSVDIENNTAHAIVYCIDKSGNTIWHRKYVTEQSVVAFDIANTMEGGMALTGSILYKNNKDIIIIKTDETGNVEWSEIIDGGAVETPHQIIQTPDYGYAIAGDTEFLFDKENWSANCFLIKTNHKGVLEWGRTYGSNSYTNNLVSISCATYGYKLSVHAQNQFLVIHTDYLGIPRPKKQFETVIDENVFNYFYIDQYNSHSGECITETNDGNFIIAGNIQNPVISKNDPFWLKTNKNGEIIWAKQLKTDEEDYICAMTPVDKNSYALIAYRNNKKAMFILIDAGGDTINTKILQTRAAAFHDIKKSNDKGFVLAGTTIPTTQNEHIVTLLVKINAAGDILWQKEFSFGKHSWENGRAIIETNDKGWLVAGYSQKAFSQKVYPFLACFGSNGKIQWSKRYDERLFELFLSVCQTPDNHFMVCGLSDNMNHTKGKIPVLQIDRKGNIINEKYLDFFDRNIGYKIKPASDNGFVIGGSSEMNHCGLLESYGIMIKIDESANVQWKKATGKTANKNAIHDFIVTNDNQYAATGFISPQWGTRNAMLLILPAKQEETPNYSGYHLSGYSLKDNEIALYWKTPRTEHVQMWVEQATDSCFENTKLFAINPNNKHLEIKGLQPETTYFYRLIQNNESQKTVESNIAEVKTKAGNSFRYEQFCNAISVYPNPCINDLYVNLNSEISGKVVVNVYNQTGVRIRNIVLEKNTDIMEQNIDLSQYASATYTVEIVSGSNRTIELVNKL